jgi:hypothetical protein
VFYGKTVTTDTVHVRALSTLNLFIPISSHDAAAGMRQCMPALGFAPLNPAYLTLEFCGRIGLACLLTATYDIAARRADRQGT